ncbi:GGDEF domain-containing protein [Marinomonas spartinae]|uniref:GGDEF domain-containing protein n=1 Tax=Marinomonas spartinae TaxID=1792290 RepID=UPI0015863A2D|nr:GGDEF domain-containing protein [Marinomonas spartinae]
MSYFQKQSRQLLGSNFTALVIDVMQAEEDAHLLKRALMQLKSNSPYFDSNELKAISLRMQYRFPIIDRKMQKSSFEPATYQPYTKKLQMLKSLLPELGKRIEAFQKDPSNKAPLVDLLTTFDVDMSFAYNELHTIIQVNSDIERRLKNKLTLLIWGLVFAFLCTLFALCLAITHLYSKREELTIQSNVDHLTQLPNRRFIAEKTQEFLSEAPDFIGLAILDLDHFKKVNDLFGHPAGDEALKAIANIIKQYTTPPHIAARLGGEEFCILFTDISERKANTICEDIRQAVEETNIPINNTSTQVTISVGLYCQANTCDAQAFRHIYQMADNALYLAKKQGRNQVVMFQKEVMDHA